MSFYFPDGKGGRRLVQIEASIPAAGATAKGGAVITGTDGLIMDGDTLKVDASKYVAKEAGKGLSTEDYTTAEKSKLASITVSGGNVVIDTSDFVKKETGKGLSTNDYTTADQNKLNSLASITTAGENITITSGVIKAKDTTYSNATTAQAGLMSATDKYKLDGLDASKYVATVEGKGLSTEDYTTAEKSKLASITVSGGNVVIDTSDFVKKETGKGLSTNDYTTADQNKLNSLASITAVGENINLVNGTISAIDTRYIEGDNIAIRGGTISAVNTTYTAGDNIGIDNGRISALYTAGANITISGGRISAGYGLASRQEDGLMSANDKAKLGNLASITTAGDNITITNGTIKAAGYELPTASQNQKGGIKVVGDGLRMVDDYLGVAVGEGLGHAPSTQEGAITLQTASATQKGGVKVGTGLQMSGDTLNCTISSGPTYNNATTTTSGLMSANDKTKLDNLASITTAGTNITITNGTIYSSDTKYTAGENITISGGTIKAAGYELPIASSSQLGGVKPGAGVNIQPSSGYLGVNLGNGLSLNGDNQIDAVTYTAGDNISISGGKISAVYNLASQIKDGLMSADDKKDLVYALNKLATISSTPATSLPTASATQKGGVIVTGNDGLTMDGDTLKATGAAQLIDKSNEAHGCRGYAGLAITQGNNTIIAEEYSNDTSTPVYLSNLYFSNGQRSWNITNNLPTASATVKGGVKIGVGLVMNGETLNAVPTEFPTASEYTKGGIKVGVGLVMNGETLNISTVSASTVYISSADFDTIMSNFATVQGGGSSVPQPV